ncbi:hypothetical protein GCM10020000_34780 [Streptomyces olivoverticillatus]
MTPACWATCSRVWYGIAWAISGPLSGWFAPVPTQDRVFSPQPALVQLPHQRLERVPAALTAVAQRPEQRGQQTARPGPSAAQQSAEQTPQVVACHTGRLS